MGGDFGHYAGLHYSSADYARFGRDLCLALLPFADRAAVEAHLSLVRTPPPAPRGGAGTVGPNVDGGESSEVSDFSSEGEDGGEVPTSMPPRPPRTPRWDRHAPHLLLPHSLEAIGSSTLPTADQRHEPTAGPATRSWRAGTMIDGSNGSYVAGWTLRQESVIRLTAEKHDSSVWQRDGFVRVLALSQ